MNAFSEMAEQLQHLFEEVYPENTSKEGKLVSALAEAMKALAVDLEVLSRRIEHIEDEVDGLSEATEEIQGNLDEMAETIDDIYGVIDEHFESDDWDDDEDFDDDDDYDDNFDDEDDDDDDDDEEDIVLYEFTCHNCGAVGYITEDMFEEDEDFLCPECGSDETEIVVADEEDF